MSVIQICTNALVKGTGLEELYWLGDSKENLKVFSSEGQKGVGDALFFAQAGYKHPYSKTFKEIGTGVFEIVKSFKTDTYRAVYAVKIGEKYMCCTPFRKDQKKVSALQKTRSRLSNNAIKHAEIKDGKK